MRLTYSRHGSRHWRDAEGKGLKVRHFCGTHMYNSPRPDVCLGDDLEPGVYRCARED